jgi:cytochrome c biogenesis protein CcmG, thiol:disulfide interchange protein DsbE
MSRNRLFQQRTRAARLARLAAPCVFCLALLLIAATGCNRNDRPSQIGEQAPGFTIHDGSQTVSLSQFRGKTVVLNFWASWCPPCLEEFPSLIQLQRQMPSIVVLAVSFDQDASAYRQYLTDNHINGITTILDLSQKSNLAYGTTRPPETYIIDASGTIRRKFIGAQDWTSPEIVNYLQHL